MSGKLSPVGEEKQSTRTSKRIKKRKQMESTFTDKSPSNLETSNKFRKKTKKTKFLSLKLELNTTATTKKGKTNASKQSKKKRVDTTPFKETVGGEEKEEEQCDTVSGYLFTSANDSTISSIHELLPSSSSATVRLDCDGGRNLSPYGSSSSSSSLIRTSLALKLDYEQVMEAWLDKGTLFVDGEPPQTVPDLHAFADVFTGGGEAGNLWTVPEMETTERLWREHREASLLRYKEKRKSRFFSKRIRYQVRKLNAEKRPRIKGRFVKRDDV